jgi:hypothetical protein
VNHDPGRDDPHNELPPGVAVCPNCRRDHKEAEWCPFCGRNPKRKPFEEYLAWLPDLRVEVEKCKRMHADKRDQIVALVDALHQELTKESLRLEP